MSVIDRPWEQPRIMWEAIKKHEETFENMLLLIESDRENEKNKIRSAFYQETSRQKDQVIAMLLEHINELSWVKVLFYKIIFQIYYFNFFVL